MLPLNLAVIEDLRNPICIQSIEEAKELPNFQEIGVVVQTTFQQNLFNEMLSILKSKCKRLYSENTICNATSERQNAVRELAQKVDFMIVIGGKQSSNTKKLAEISGEYCLTQKIESVEELDINKLQDMEKIGISAGTSTPQEQIDEVISFLRPAGLG